MDFELFKKSLDRAEPPADISAHLRSLWYDAKGDWEQSHEIIQHIGDAHASWIHAYLHRKEGDNGNADYWYHKAGRKRPSITLDQEWRDIAGTLLK